jgi:hypothetical protein
MSHLQANGFCASTLRMEQRSLEQLLANAQPASALNNHHVADVEQRQAGLDSLAGKRQVRILLWVGELLYVYGTNDSPLRPSGQLDKPL